MDEHDALEKAVEAAQYSPCKKSKRGVVIWNHAGVISYQWNSQPAGYTCDGSDTCRRDCGKICIHAETAAILDAHRHGKSIWQAEMLHVKVVNGLAVPSGPPGCWQCSRNILESGIAGVWLLHSTLDGGGLLIKRYTTTEFHDETLRNCKLHPYG